jgi:hypothetical protein
VSSGNVVKKGILFCFGVLVILGAKENSHMNQLTFDFVETMILLSVFREALERQRVLVPVPSEDFFYALIEEGELDGKKLGGRYFIVEKSAKKWVSNLHNCAVAA